MNKEEKLSAGQRIKKYLSGEPVDHLPYALALPEPALANIYGYTLYEYEKDNDVFIDIIKRRTEDLGLEGANVRLSLRTMGAACGSNLVFPENGLDYIDDHVLKDYANFDFKLPDPYNNPILSPLLERAIRVQEEFPDMQVTTGVVGPLSTAVAIRPIEMFLKDTKKDPDNAKRLLDFSVEASLRWVEVFTKEVGKGSASISEPVTTTDIISLKQFEEFSLPYLEKMVKGLFEITGFKPSLHICGHTKAIWPYLRDLEISSFSVDNCEDMRETKEAFGDKMLIVGNVPPVEVLRFGSAQDVYESVKDCIEKAGDSPKGYMISSGCQVAIGTPLENLKAYVSAVEKYGKGAQIGQLPEGLK